MTLLDIVALRKVAHDKHLKDGDVELTVILDKLDKAFGNRAIPSI
jgi:hypothetical protein